MFTKPLPQRLVALYAYFTNFNIIVDWENNKISLGGKLPIFNNTIFIVLFFDIFSLLSNF